MSHSPFTTSLGEGQLPRVLLRADDGAEAEVYLHGAHVTHWRPAGQSANHLFLSRTSGFADGVAIRGGVPVIFPQFAAQGNLPKHGFARTTSWELEAAKLLENGAATATLSLRDNAHTRAIWPYSFHLRLSVTVQYNSLQIQLSVTNTDQCPITFTNALHTYFAVSNIHETEVHGLMGSTYHDTAHHLADCHETHEKLTFNGEMDRIYHCAPDTLRLVAPDRHLSIIAPGFTDTVIWNPGEAKGKALSDLEADGYINMLCIEAGVIRQPITLQPGQIWSGEQHISCLS